MLRMRKTKLIIAILIVVAIIIALGAYWYFTVITSTKVKKVAIFAYPTDFPDIDPSIAFENEHVILANVYEALVYYDAGSSKPLKPWLATEWSSTPDGLTWTFKLRKGVKFHDGTSFNAESVKFSIERTKNLGLGAAYIFDPIKEVQIVNDYEIKIILSYAAPLPQILSSTYGAWIMSQKIPENATEWFNQGHDAGTGPYKIETYEKGFQVVLTKFNDYWGGWDKPHFEKIIIKTIRDATVRFQAIKAGEVDITTELPLEQVEALLSEKNVRIVTSPSLRNLLGMINTKREPTNNVLIRQALSYAFPYDIVINTVWKGYANQSKGPIPVGMFGHFEDMLYYKYDLDKAKELLAKAGYPNGGFTIILTYTSGDHYEKQVAELYKAELDKLGINLEIRELTTKAKYALARGDPTKAQHILLFYWWPTFITPYDFLYNLFHTSEKIIFNFAYASYPEYDELIDEAYKIEGTNLEEALELYRKAQEIVVKEALALFIWDQNSIFVVSSKIHNFKPNPAYTEVVFFYNIWAEE